MVPVRHSLCALQLILFNYLINILGGGKGGFYFEPVTLRLQQSAGYSMQCWHCCSVLPQPEYSHIHQVFPTPSH